MAVKKEDVSCLKVVGVDAITLAGGVYERGRTIVAGTPAFEYVFSKGVGVSENDKECDKHKPLLACKACDGCEVAELASVDKEEVPAEEPKKPTNRGRGRTKKEG